MFVDFNQGALAALLPILISTHHYNYALAATLVFAMNLVSSIVQPLFGYLSDRYQNRFVIIAAIIIAGIGFSSLSWVQTYALMIMGVLICGLGIAAYHPDSAKFVNALSGGQKAQGMSIFSFGGNIGFALGPIVITMIVNSLGMKGINWLLVFAVVIAFILWEMQKKKSFTQENNSIKESANHKIQNSAKSKDDWKHFGILTTVLFGRSIVFYGLNTFLAIYWISVLKQNNTQGSIALSLLFIVGSIGTLLGGRLADKIGLTPVIKGAFIILPFLLLILVSVQNLYLSYIMLIPLGLTIFMPYSAMVILGQKYLPDKLGLSSGVTLGLAVSVGGIASPLLGIAADHTKVAVVLVILTVVSLIPAVASLFLAENKN